MYFVHLCSMRIIVAPDKFKGSLSSPEVCRCIAAGIRSVLPSASLHLLPLADGGDGFAAVLQQYLHTTTVTCVTQDPLGRPLTASYQLDENNRTAIIEMAAASGLVLLSPQEYNPLLASSYGTGVLIKDAMSRGAVTIRLGLGGSATNDAGMGILAALGFRFCDAAGKELPPSGASLQQVEKITAPVLPQHVRFELACDVQNPLLGPDGAAYTYAPQKGADAAMVQQLDRGLEHFAGVVEQHTGTSHLAVPGAGAAGGTAFGLLSFLRAVLRDGASLVLEASGLQQELPGARLVFTGEGKIDRQTLQGKLVQRVAAAAQTHRVPVIALCGMLELDAAQLQAQGIVYACSLASPGIPPAAAIAQAPGLLQQAAAHGMHWFLHHR
jgi:glycerate kinase